MIAYMIMDRKTNRWWRRGVGASWRTKQEEGSIWSRTGPVALAIRHIQRCSPSSEPVKIQFVMTTPLDIVVLDGETWIYDQDCDTWLWGTANNGCGVFIFGNDWCANIVTPHAYVDVDAQVGPCTTRDEAMTKALKLLRELKNDE